MTVDDASSTPYRRMGAILVEQGAITAEQLAESLVRQGSTGRMLGEICVEQWGMDRFALADALSVQWDEMRLGGEAAHDGAAGKPAAEPATPSAKAAELRALLDEAEAARAEFASKTDELTRRLAVLETLVIGVSSALEDLRSAK